MYIVNFCLPSFVDLPELLRFAYDLVSKNLVKLELVIWEIHMIEAPKLPGLYLDVQAV